MKGRNSREFRHPSEALALEFLEAREHTLLRHNYHLRFIEIDLITATSDACVHFTEVKHWRDASFRHPLETINERRKGDLHRAAKTFLHELSLDAEAREIFHALAPRAVHPDEIPVSFDLIWLLSPDEIQHFENLF